jgi:DHA2 family multidrug resistance protein
VATASSFLNVAQRVGGAFGIALLNTFVTSSIHAHAVRLGSGIPLQSGSFQRLAARTAEMAGTAAGGSPTRSAALLAAHEIHVRASVLGFDTGFVVAGLILLAGLPLCLLLRPTAGRSRSPGRARPGGT